MEKILNYLNPISRLSEKQTSVFFPLLLTVTVSFVFEVYVNFVLQDPMAVGLYAIVLFIFLIVYFSFRDGIRGGLITASLAILYYFYIMYSRDYSGETLKSGVEITLLLGFVYFIIALIIGWLKRTVYKLFEKEANQKNRLQLVIDQLPVGVVVINEKRQAEFSNKQIKKILGSDISKDIVVGKDLIVPIKVNGKEIPPSSSPLYQAFMKGKEIKREYSIERKFGKEGFISTKASAIKDNKGKTIAAVIVVDDITEKKALEKRKEDFVNMASHELKTPLTSIKLYLELLQKYTEQVSKEKALDSLEKINTQINKLQEIVFDLLDVSRLQTGKMKFHKEVFSLNELVAETIGPFSQTTKRQTLEFNNTSEVSVRGDRFRIYQVITNLLTNASKYSPEKSTIVISIQKRNKKAIVSVKDEGRGIEASEKKYIFERLYQAKSQTEPFSGLGMGLFISRSIVKRHRGSIWVKSKKGKGSTFYFSLPIVG